MPHFWMVMLMVVTALQNATQGATADTLVLLPRPRTLVLLPGLCKLEPARAIVWRGGDRKAQVRAAGIAQSALGELGSHWTIATGKKQPLEDAGLILHVDPAQCPRPESYRLTITPDQIRIVAHDDPGVFYAVMTLQQLIRQAPRGGELTCLRIEDWPDYPNRGVMLDISRDKVPTMESLRALIDQLAAWKINQFQLYTEHTFAYRGHREVWAKASPMTASQIRMLDRWCRERFIELVPNQNSFGHFERWLKHPRYRPLGEVDREGASCLAPGEPGSIRLLDELYAQLLPNFSSRQFNVGCDETMELGQGKSKAAVQARGEGTVYLDFLRQIHSLVQARQHTMQCWGDIIIAHPELIPQLPEGIIALEWGYEAKHPFDEDGRKFAAAGVPYYVCPGTSSWVSLAGRTDNALANLRNAAESGLAHGAIGYLITDWGDGGHPQTLPVSYPGFAYGAALAWCVEANRDLPLARALDLYAFEDASGVLGQVTLDLGNAYRMPGALYFNASVLYFLLMDPHSNLHQVPASQMTIKSLQKTEALIEVATARLDRARSSRPDAALIADELRLNAAMMTLACQIGIARLRHGGIAGTELPREERQPIAREMERILQEHRRVWLARNRPGGLQDSAGSFERLVQAYGK